MKNILLLLAVFAVSDAHGQIINTGRHRTVFAAGGGGINGFTHARPLVIDHTKVPATQTNFTTLVSTTITGLKSTGSGGYVTDAQGDDIVFTSDSGCTTLLSWEPLDLWTNSSGAIIAWVKIASVSSSVDTTFYVCYGKASITTFQGGSTGAAWDSSYKLVAHLPDGSSLTSLDSTANGNNSTTSSATATTGQVDGAAAFNGTSGDITFPTISLTSVTVSLWANSSNWAAQTGTLAEKENVNAAWLLLDSTGTLLWRGGAVSADVSCTAPSNSAWHHIVATQTGTSGVMYIDGTQCGTASPTAIGNGSGLIHIGDIESGSLPFSGSLDEFSISNVVRDSNWVAARFNNENSPSTFITVGSEI